MINYKPLPPRHTLSKSTFVRGCQCAKSLWLYKNKYELRDKATEAQESIFLQGTDVGILARQLFPSGVDASPIDQFHYRHAIADTSRYIAQGYSVIFEAAFQHEGVMCAIDVLVKVRDKWYAYEVKSSTSVKDQFVNDAALQYYVMTNAGLELEDIFIVHINKQYTRSGELNLRELFTKESVKEKVLELQPSLQLKVEELKAIAVSKEMPVLRTGDHCYSPYHCDFYSFCWKDLEAVEEVDEKENIVVEEVKNFVERLEYPYYFLDTKSYMLAVPEYDGHWPYLNVPFQFSIHKQEKETATLNHHCFLSDINCDPCKNFAEELINALDNTGSIIVYDKRKEVKRLSELQKSFPEFSTAFADIIDRMIDLMDPFQLNYYYLPEMKGSCTLEDVSKAMLPDLTNESLMIKDSGHASAAFYNLRFEKDIKKIQKTKEALQTYCHRNTLSMFMILQKLKAV